MILGEAGEAFFVRQEEVIEEEEVKIIHKENDDRVKNQEIVRLDD